MNDLGLVEASVLAAFLGMSPSSVRSIESRHRLPTRGRAKLYDARDILRVPGSHDRLAPEGPRPWSTSTRWASGRGGPLGVDTELAMAGTADRGHRWGKPVAQQSSQQNEPAPPGMDRGARSSRDCEARGEVPAWRVTDDPDMTRDDVGTTQACRLGAGRRTRRHATLALVNATHAQGS